MTRTAIVLATVVLSVSCRPAPAPAVRRAAAPRVDEPVWHYEGAEGPEHWGDLSLRFAACRDGHQQSPIDVPAVRGGVPPALRVHFPPASLRIEHHEHMADVINNGHTVQINYDGDTLMLGGTAYELVQYHFHDPSEHTLSGRRFPMEMHLVHRSRSGELAVVAVFVEQGRHNTAFDPIWPNLPAQTGEAKHYDHLMVDVDALLPRRHTSYRYDGSLTTPPCTEGVQWLVLATPITLDASQIGAFSRLIHHNNRPLQPLYGRPIVADVVH